MNNGEARIRTQVWIYPERRFSKHIDSILSKPYLRRYDFFSELKKRKIFYKIWIGLSNIGQVLSQKLLRGVNPQKKKLETLS
jgi:hypothetical protein